MFKQNWESSSLKNFTEQEVIEQMVQMAFPGVRIKKQQVLSGGCSNLIIKIDLEDASCFVLKIYLRDPKSAVKEQKIAALVGNIAPAILFVGECSGYVFACQQFIDGISLRDLLLSDIPYDLSDISYQAGQVLAQIHVPYDESPPKISYQEYGLSCLEKLETSLKEDIRRALLTHSFPTEAGKLVHGDFDPANIFVRCVEGRWRIAAILDWEFACSGSILCDVATMLRYAHQMPPEFTDSFLAGLAYPLPPDWHRQVDMLTIVFLLDCLLRCDPQQSPNKWQDCWRLIERIIVSF